MPFELKLAWRYFRSKRKGLVRFTSAAAVIGIAAGIASLIIAQALSRGFADEVREKVLENTAHITVDSSEAKIANPNIIERKLLGIAGVKKVELTSFESAVVRSDEKSSYAVIRVKPEEFNANGAGRDDSVVFVSLGDELAKKLWLDVGDNADIVAIGAGGEPKSKEVNVAGIFSTGLYEYDSTWIYISPRGYEKLKGETFNPKVFSVYIEDIFGAEKVSDEIKKAVGANFKVLGWQEANKPLFTALSLERKVSLAIISLIIFIAALNIATTLALLVNERKLDIAVLRTCGAQTRKLIAIFLFEGAILSAVGIAAGTLLGLLACAIGNYFQVISLSKEVYSLSEASFRPAFYDVFFVICAAAVLSFAAMIYPAVRLSKIKPLENFQNQ